MELIKPYKGKRVLITGHTGFKGSWLTVVFNHLGSEVLGYALPASQDSLFDEINGDQLCTSVYGDILDKGKLKKTIADFKPDYVFHMAAQSLVIDSYTNPLYTFEVNAIGTANLLMSLTELSDKCSTVIITTDKVYENNNYEKAFTEQEPLGGYDPYSASKACAEIVTSSLRNSFFKDQNNKQAIASARAGNVIGGGDWSENRLLPDIIRSLRNHEPVKIRNPYSVRPWQHVLDPLIGYMKLALALDSEEQRFCGAYNFGPSHENVYTVSDIAKIALDAWGEGKIEIDSSEDKKYEAAYLNLDSSKATNDLGWKPVLDVKESVLWTVEWYKKHVNDKQGALEFTKGQIENFLKIV
ncbi:CDP-glucose 4,6-dehydratase [Fulvivirga ulvae]|uniref:CDP-glucose 4,6-dehydratase n=1 Tax=Fulvivirga ulvae TaxID=2904245 RepID=UPI001F1CE638|nr:CDP-glucose 4,6-dehydratase [Fulvivirga ulvae]UII33377.1 CDP-glucose 4,6-dehydratase [Fulvivirga ulvae]